MYICSSLLHHIPTWLGLEYKVSFKSTNSYVNKEQETCILEHRITDHDLDLSRHLWDLAAASPSNFIADFILPILYCRFYIPDFIFPILYFFLGTNFIFSRFYFIFPDFIICIQKNFISTQMHPIYIQIKFYFPILKFYFPILFFVPTLILLVPK